MILPHYANQFIGITCAARDSIVDTAAEDGCIGFSQLPKITESLRPFGLQWVWVSRPGAIRQARPARALEEEPNGREPWSYR